MGMDSLVSSQAAAARSGYVAVNWAIGDPRYKTGAATATAVAPNDLVIRSIFGSGAVFTKAKVVLGSDPAHLITTSIGRLLTQVGPDVKTATVNMAMPVAAQDTLSAYIDNANNSEIDHLVLILDRPEVRGASRGSYKRIWPLRGASTTASVAHTWGAKTITWDNALSNPKGKYHILGMSCVGAVSVAARVYNPDNPNLRPTVLCNPTAVTGQMTEFASGDIVEFQGDQLGNLVFEELNETTTNAFEFLVLIGEL